MADHVDHARRSSWFPFRVSMTHRHPAIQAATDQRTLGERVADNIASFGGSWPFIFIFLGLIAGWMVLNTVVLEHVLKQRPFDPYPYIALNLVLSGLAGIQAPIIMMSQNRAAARDEVLASAHYDETQKIDDILCANHDLTVKVHELAEQIHALTAEIAAKAGAVLPAAPDKPSP